MTKKEYIIRILTPLQKIRPYASGLLYLLESQEPSEGVLDTIITFLSTALQESQSSLHKQALQKSLSLVEQMRQQEQDQLQQDQQEIAELEDMLATL